MLVIAAACFSTMASAQDASPEFVSSETLMLGEVLASAQQYFPVILSALVERRVARGDIMIAESQFDMVFSADTFNRITGFYDGQVATAKVERPVRDYGAKVFGQYRISNGDFPIYEDEFYTNTGGQIKAGAVLSLLRDREIDSYRFAESDARMAMREADLEVLLTRIGVQQQAAMAYWNWVAAGAQMAVYEELLANAVERDAGLIRQVSSGARAQFYLTENQQNITRRRTLLLRAQLDNRMAANQLSMYYRGSGGQPITPLELQLPPIQRPESTTLVPLDWNTQNLKSTISSRPEVLQLKNVIARAMERVRLEENSLKPRLDLSVEVATGLGNVGEGGPSRDSTDTIVALNFTVPFEQREAKARVAQSEAKLEALQIKQRYLEEQIDLELRAIMMELEYSRELAELAALEVEQSQQLEQAELSRFESGASDFFLVNIREEAVANARIKSISAMLDTRLAQVSFDAATIDLERLQIESDL